MNSKAEDAFRTISEAAELLDLPQHVLRFWETKFTQIRPLKRGGGRRYYRPDDIDLLKGIRHLLYEEGFRISAVQRIIKEQGARHVAAIGQGAATAPEPGAKAGLGEDDFSSDLPEAEEANFDLSDEVALGDTPLPVRTAEAARPAGSPMRKGLSEASRTRLRSTLYELLECKRLLDGSRSRVG